MKPHWARIKVGSRHKTFRFSSPEEVEAFCKGFEEGLGWMHGDIMAKSTNRRTQCPKTP